MRASARSSTNTPPAGRQPGRLCGVWRGTGKRCGCVSMSRAWKRRITSRSAPIASACCGVSAVKGQAARRAIAGESGAVRAAHLSHPRASDVPGIGRSDGMSVQRREICSGLAHAVRVPAGDLYPVIRYGGDPMPSSEYRAITKRLKEAGSLLGINVIDHIIVGEERYFSFADEGLL
jgi:hypothetical protein